MSDERPKLGEVLVRMGAVTQADIDDALSEQSDGNPFRVGELLLARGVITPDTLGRALAERHELPFVEIPRPISPMAYQVPMSLLRQNNMVPFGDSEEGVLVAIADPSDSAGLEKLASLYNRAILVHVASLDDVLGAFASMQHGPRQTAPLPTAPANSAPAEAAKARALGKLQIKKVAVAADVPVELPAWMNQADEPATSLDAWGSWPAWVSAEGREEGDFEMSQLLALEAEKDVVSGAMLEPGSEIRVAAALRRLFARGVLSPAKLVHELKQKGS